MSRSEARLLRAGAWQLAVFCVLLVAFVAFIVWKIFPGHPSEAEVFESVRRSNLQLLAQLSGPARAPEHFYGTWRRPLAVADHDVVRMRVREAPGMLRVQVWYQCKSAPGECDAGEHAAQLERDRSGAIARITLEAGIADGRIRLTITPGREASAPILLMTEVRGVDSIWKVVSGAQAPIERERAGVPPGVFAGDWFWPRGVAPGNFAKMAIRETGEAGIAVRAWVVCEPAGLCDLGEQAAVVERIEGGLAVALRVRYESDPRTRLDARMYPPDQVGMEIRTVVTKLVGHVHAPADRRGRGGFNQWQTYALPERHIVTRHPHN